MSSAVKERKPHAPEHDKGAAIVVTCEHGGNRIPMPYRGLFAAHRDLLASQRGFDAGALVMAQSLAAALDAPLLTATVSRLLVDLNRSIGHPRLHFEPVLALPDPQRKRILTRHYQPYRRQAERLVEEGIASHGRVIHVSCHSFTPELDGKRRTADIGLLYDPARPGEKTLCARWKRTLENHAPELSVRRNYPYAGRNDGLTAWLRKQHSTECYVGIELELNQQLVGRETHQWAALREVVIASFRTALAMGNELGSRPPSPHESRRPIQAPRTAVHRVHCPKGAST
jgi:predicted N-formylglutamate amidohydrolase